MEIAGRLPLLAITAISLTDLVGLALPRRRIRVDVVSPSRPLSGRLRLVALTTPSLLGL